MNTPKRSATNAPSRHAGGENAGDAHGAGEQDAIASTAMGVGCPEAAEVVSISPQTEAWLLSDLPRLEERLSYGLAFGEISHEDASRLHERGMEMLEERSEAEKEALMRPGRERVAERAKVLGVDPETRGGFLAVMLDEAVAGRLTVARALPVKKGWDRVALDVVDGSFVGATLTSPRSSGPREWELENLLPHLDESWDSTEMTPEESATVLRLVATVSEAADAAWKMTPLGTSEPLSRHFSYAWDRDKAVLSVFCWDDLPFFPRHKKSDLRSVAGWPTDREVSEALGRGVKFLSDGPDFREALYSPVQGLDMTGFEYTHGNSVAFHGAYGLVELVYVGEPDPLADPFGVEDFEPYFAAFSDHAHARGITPDAAIEHLYSEIAKVQALRDLGRI